MATITTLKSGDYTDTSVWSGGVVPVDGDKVTISKLGTATSRTTSGAISAGASSIPVTAGTGTGLIGEVIEFDSRPGEYYELTTGFTASAGTAVVTPVLAGAIASGATLRLRGHKVKLIGARVAGDDTTTGFTVNGVLYHDRAANSSLTCKGTFTTGSGSVHDMGTVVDPISSVKAEIFLNYSASMAALKYQYSKNAAAVFYSYGKVRSRRTTLMAQFTAGTATAQIADVTGWEAGDRVFFLPTTMNTGAEQMVVSSVTPTSGTAGTVVFTTNIVSTRASGGDCGNLSSNLRITEFNQSFGARVSMQTSIEKSVVAYDMEFFTACNTNSAFTIGNSSGSFTPANQGYYGRCAWTNNVVNSQPVLTATKPCIIEDSCIFSASSQSFIDSNMAPSMNRCTIWSALSPYSNTGFSGPASPIYNSIIAGRSSDRGVLRQSNTGIDIRSCRMITDSSVTTALIEPISSISGQIQSTDFCPFGMGTSRVLINIGNPTDGDISFVDCVYGAAPVMTYGINYNSARILIVRGQRYSALGTLITEGYRGTGYQVLDSSTRLSGDASLKMSNKVASTELFESITSVIAAGQTRRVIGYVQRDSTYGSGSMPAVVLSIPGMTDVVSSVSDVAGSFQKVDVSITNTTGATSALTLKLRATGAVNGNCWFDGIPVYPFVQVVRHYGFEFDEGNPFRVVDSTLTSSEATVAAITGISINHSTQTISITSAKTAAQVYAYCIWNLCQTANLTVANHISGSEPNNTFTTTYTVSLSGSGAISGTYTDSTGLHAVVSATTTGLPSGARYQLYNVTDSVELLNSVSTGEISWSTNFTSNKTLRLRWAKIGSVPEELFSVLTSGGASFLVTNDVDTVYVANGIDGTTVTGITWDAPNVDIDLDDADGRCSWKEIYASYIVNLTTSTGISSFVGKVVAQDTANYVFSNDIVFNNNNVSVGVVVGGDGYGSRSDGSYMGGTGNIQFDNGKAYVASGGAIASDVWTNSKALTVGKFLALK